MSINETHLKKKLKLGNKIRYSIVIIDITEIFMLKLCVKRLWFRQAFKLIKKYNEIWYSFIYMTCWGIFYYQIMACIKKF